MIRPLAPRNWKLNVPRDKPPKTPLKRRLSPRTFYAFDSDKVRPRYHPHAPVTLAKVWEKHDG